MSAKRKFAAASVLAIAGVAVAIPASAQQVIRPDAVIVRPRAEMVVPAPPVLAEPEFPGQPAITAQPAMVIPARPVIQQRVQVVEPVQQVIPTPEEQMIAEPLPTTTYQAPDAANPAWPHPPAVAQGPAPYSPTEYAMDTPISITGRVVGVSPSTSSFKVQTPTEAWTVVMADGSGIGVRNGQAVSLTGYPHGQIRNQLLMGGFGAGSVAELP